MTVLVDACTFVGAVILGGATGWALAVGIIAFWGYVDRWIRKGTP